MRCGDGSFGKAQDKPFDFAQDRRDRKKRKRGFKGR